MTGTTASVIYLGAKSATKAELTVNRSVGYLEGTFTRLTPRMLSHIPIQTLPPHITNAIQLPEGAVKVPTEVLIEGLSSLCPDSPIVEAQVGAEFRTLTPELRTFQAAVSVMSQALSDKTQGVVSSTNPNGPALTGTFAMDKKVADARGVTAWLDGIDHPDYKDRLGVFFKIDRFYGSLLDGILIWVPLDVTISDHVRA